MHLDFGIILYLIYSLTVVTPGYVPQETILSRAVEATDRLSVYELLFHNLSEYDFNFFKYLKT